MNRWVLAAASVLLVEPVAAAAAVVLEAPVPLDDVRGRRLRLPRGSLILSVTGDGVSVEGRAVEPWLFDLYLGPDRPFWLRLDEGSLHRAPRVSLLIRGKLPASAVCVSSFGDSVAGRRVV
jgi:hypothetical protein